MSSYARSDAGTAFGLAGVDEPTAELAFTMMEQLVARLAPLGADRADIAGVITSYLQAVASVAAAEAAVARSIHERDEPRLAEPDPVLMEHVLSCGAEVFDALHRQLLLQAWATVV